MFYKKAILKNFANFTGKHLYWSLFLIKLQAFDLRLQKETPTQVCSCEYCDNFKNIYLEERLRAVASALEVSLFVLYRGVVRFYSLGQKIMDKFTNLNKIGFSMECFTTNFSRLYSPNVKICLLSGLVFLEIS